MNHIMSRGVIYTIYEHNIKVQHMEEHHMNHIM